MSKCTFCEQERTPRGECGGEGEGMCNLRCLVEDIESFANDAASKVRVSDLREMIEAERTGTDPSWRTVRP